MSRSLQPENIKFDTSGRAITFDIGDMTFANVYLPSGNNLAIRNSHENYAAETIPQLPLSCKDSGCIGGGWNSIINAEDATKNPNQKMFPLLKRLVSNFSWTDSFRSLHPTSATFTRYYEYSKHGD